MSAAQILRFGVVGVVNTFSGLLVIYSLKYFAGAGDVLANMLGYAAGMTISYFLNGRWTFRYKGKQNRALLRFGASMAISYGMNLLTVLVAIHFLGLNAYLAQALGMPVFTVCSFLLSKFWVFKE
jgi:putative flippase GtrA